MMSKVDSESYVLVGAETMLELAIQEVTEKSKEDALKTLYEFLSEIKQNKMDRLKELIRYSETAVKG
jgi:hypothetical protein